MTNKQQRDLHERLALTETEHTPQGLPICTDEQILQRRSIIATWERDRKRKRAEREAVQGRL